MSKIICDVCGTSYPDTTTQCPICGCVRSADVEAVISGGDSVNAVAGNTYTYVKGGRFSKANVKKRNSGKPVATAAAPKAAPAKPAEPAKQPVAATAAAPAKTSTGAPAQKSNVGLIVVIIVLLLAIVAVLSYIAIRFVVPGIFGDNTDENYSEYVPTPDVDPNATTEATDPDISCTAIVLSDVEVYLTTVGDTYTLTVTPEPADTTDEVLFATEDDTVATVDEYGVITAVAEGETIVTVTCGSQTELCRVVCELENESTDSELALVADTYTFTKKGETWTCYTGSVSADQITWSSDDAAVATVANGVVTAVGAGTTTIRAVYNETEAVCEILCEESVDSETETAAGNYKFNTSDPNEMMLKIGESFGLQLRDENKKALTGVTFTSSNTNICTVTEKGTVKGVAYGNTTISAVYNGVIYTCKVYVR